MRLIDGGQTPEQAIRSGFLIGKYGWWPSWLLRVVTERALAGTLDDDDDRGAGPVRVRRR